MCIQDFFRTGVCPNHGSTSLLFAHYSVEENENNFADVGFQLNNGMHSTTVLHNETLLSIEWNSINLGGSPHETQSKQGLRLSIGAQNYAQK